VNAKQIMLDTLNDARRSHEAIEASRGGLEAVRRPTHDVMCLRTHWKRKPNPSTNDEA
jgi:hypothetical protein